MSEQEAVRQLVKSPPELWAQCSDAERLARHLNRFGEIRITALEPESTVAWEGESVSGTVTLEASGWGTRVRLTARGAVPDPELGAVPAPDPGAVTTPGPTPDPEPVAASSAPAPKRLTGLLSSFLGRRGVPGPADAVPALEPSPAPSSPREPAPNRVAEAAEPAGQSDLVAELEAALDSLGQAHHRPYSRA
jgi:hypothetical protein